MASKEAVQQDLDGLDEKMTALYAEFTDEDRAMAEDGFSDYIKGLSKEDTAGALIAACSDEPLRNS